MKHFSGVDWHWGDEVGSGWGQTWKDGNWASGTSMLFCANWSILNYFLTARVRKFVAESNFHDRV